MVEQNRATVIQATSLAVMALTEAGSPAAGESVDRSLGRALAFLGSQQDPAGRLGPACDKRVLVQAMGTSALAGLARTRPEARVPLKKAVQALMAMKVRGPDGWSKDGASGQIHAVATAWALSALGRAQAAGAEVPTGWQAKVADSCMRLVDRRTGTAGLFRPGDGHEPWGATVATGAALAALGRDAGLLEAQAVKGAHLDMAALERADLETLALLALWSQRDKGLAGRVQPALSKALAAWGGDARGGVRALRPSPWDAMEGEVYATAMRLWLTALTRP